MGTSVSRMCAVMTGLSKSVQDRTSSPYRIVSQIVVSDGGSIPCSSAGTYATLSVVDQVPQRFTSLSSASQNYEDTQRFLCSKTMEKTPVPSEKIPTGSVSLSQNIMTDASLRGWEAVHQGCPVRGVWSEEQRSWHINHLELLAVFLALRQFLTQLTGCHVLIRTDNMMVVSYLNRQGGLRSRPLYRLARSVLLWAQTKFLSDSSL